jgi:hypothetical protein
MLRLPDVGVRLSIAQHNSDLDVLCDWVEASLLLFDESLSPIEVVDVLMENHVYREQDFARAMIEQVWAAIARRQNWLNASRVLRVDQSRLVRTLEWKEVPAHTFCLVVALRRCFKAWSATLGPNYVVQGQLFERVTEEALKQNGWTVFRTGWAGVAAVPDFRDVVDRIANHLNEPATVGVDIPQDVKDQGLDLLCYRPFQDRRGGHHLCMVQCASGDNWRTKLKTPSSELWRELIRFSSPHPRAIAVPFAFPEDATFRTTRLSADGVFLDRFRILEAGYAGVGWESENLRTELVQWLEPRIASLPSTSA